MLIYESFPRIRPNFIKARTLNSKVVKFSIATIRKVGSGVESDNAGFFIFSQIRIMVRLGNG